MKKILFTLTILLACCIQLFAQPRDYTAMVVDAETGEALHYASVYIAENRGTITNQDGKFIISAAPDEVLQFKFIGYENLSVKASEMGAVIRLNPATQTMKEISVFPRNETSGGDNEKTECGVQEIQEGGGSLFLPHYHGDWEQEGTGRGFHDCTLGC